MGALQIPLGKELSALPRPRVHARPRRRILFERLFAFYVYIMLILPTGSVYGVNVKFITFAFLMLLALSQNKRYDFRSLVFLLAPLLFLPWFVVAQVNNFPLSSSLGQYKDIVSMLLGCWVALIYCGRSNERRLKLVRLVIDGMIAASVVKELMILYAQIVPGGLGATLTFLDHVFAVQITGGDNVSIVGRINFLSDTLLPVVIFAVIAYRIPLGISKLRAVLYVALFTNSLIYGFSRWQWFFGLAALLLSTLATGKLDRFKALLLCTLIGLSVLFNSRINSILGERLDDQHAATSDDVRIEQFAQLETMFVSSPFVGSGIGSYSRDFDRGNAHPYSYEIEWVQIAAQFGVAGLWLIMMLAAVYFHGLYPSQGQVQRKLVLAAVLCLWAIGGFTNPGILQSEPSLAYALIMALADWQPKAVDANRKLRLVLAR